jgi:hypothetical protein
VAPTSVAATAASSAVSPAVSTPGGGTSSLATADPRTTADDLATTGGSSQGLWFGVVLVGAGVVIVAVTRSRPTSE